MRLGQRLSGGMAAALEGSALERSGKSLQLKLQRSLEPLAGKLIEGRLPKAGTDEAHPPLVLVAHLDHPGFHVDAVDGDRHPR